MPTAHHFLCLFHIQENLRKNLRCKLAQDCLNHTLQHCFKAWAKYYQVKYFTAGIQSTQRVEMMNRIIKNGVSSSSSLLFPEVIELLKEYLPPHILSVQFQQILGSLLYRAMLIPRETINTIQEAANNISLSIDGIQLSDILEIWELSGLTAVYKHYVVLLIDRGTYVLVQLLSTVD
ncbi:19638_t:CDS:2, partial [Gigaspora rosea]